MEFDGKIIPLEVKAEDNLKAKSLKTYMEKKNPETYIKSSLKAYKIDGIIHNILLYLIGNFLKINRNFV